MTTHVLYVEDSPFDIELFKASLGTSNYKITTTDSFKELDTILSNGVDIVVSDYNLRGFDGLNVLQKVRETNPEIPFIFLSSTIGEERAVALIKAGATDFVLKDNINKIGYVIERAYKELITRRERKEFKQEVEEKNIMFTTLLNSQADMVVLLDQNGRITHVNEAFCNYFSTTPANSIGIKGTILLPHADADEINHKVLSSNKSYDYHLETSLGGKRRILDILKSPLRIHDETKGIVVVIRDITERKLLEEEKNKDQFLLMQAEKQTRLGSFELDPETDIVMVSQNLMNLLQLKPGNNSISVKKLMSYVHTEDLPLFSEKFNKAISENQDFEMEYRYCVGQEEQTRYCKTVLKPYNNGSNIIYYGTIQDTTEERKTSMAVLNIQEKERERISKELHDNVGQKLSACSMFMNAEPINYKKVKLLINDSLNDIRMLSRTLTSSYLEDDNLLDAIYFLIENLPNSEQINFNPEFDELSISNSRRMQLYRIIQEMLNNGAKYSQATEINLKITENSKMLKLCYDDNGVGFDIENQKIGNGIRNMKERTRYCHGEFFIDSTANEGTSILIKIPLLNEKDTDS